MFKSILWDNDGILVQTEEWYFEANRQILASVGVELTLEIYRETFMKQSGGAWHLIPDVTDGEITDLRSKRNVIYAEFLQTEQILVEGVEDVLATLHSKIGMGVVTSSRKDHFQMIHERSGLLKYFDFIVASGDYAQSKPEPDPYWAGIERTGNKAQECLAIEDTERGLLAAKRAGLTCWVIPSDMTRGGDFSLADRVLDTIAEVPTLLAL